MEIKSHVYSIIGGLLSGIAVGAVTNYRDQKAGEPSIVEKVKKIERGIYQDGEKQALLLAKVKQDAKLAAAMDTKK